MNVLVQRFKRGSRYTAQTSNGPSFIDFLDACPTTTSSQKKP